MPLVPFHGWLADGYKAMPIPAVAVFSGVVSKVAAYGFLRIVLPLFPYAVGALPDADAAARAGLDHVGARSWRSPPPTRGWSSPTRASPSSASSRSGSSRCARPGGQGALLQMVNHGLVTAPLFFIVAALAARAGGSEDARATWAGSRSARRCSPRCALIVDAGHPGDARLVELHRRVHDPARRLPSQARDLGDRVRSASSAPRCTRCGCSSRRSTTASGVKVTSREIGLVEAIAIVPLVARDPGARASIRSSGCGARSPRCGRPSRRRSGASVLPYVRGRLSDGGAADDATSLATAHITGPHIDWRALSPLRGA